MKKINANVATNIEKDYFRLNNELNIPKNGTIQINKDREAVHAYFLQHINPNTVYFGSLKEKLKYLVENNYIKSELLDLYTPEFIKEVFEFMYNAKFRFRTFIGAKKFYSQYALKTEDGERYLERYEDRLAFNALSLANGDTELAMSLADELIHQRYQPATPTFLNSGKSRGGEMVSCFLLNTADDMNSIGRVINSSLQLSKMGGGVGINLTNLRGKGDPIKGILGLADGVVPVMKMLEDAFSYANQLGQRNGSGVVYLNVFHPDIMEFLAVRKENADEKVRIKTLSLGLVVPDKFYELIKTNEAMYLFSPHDVYKEYGVDFSELDITKEYTKLVENANIRKTKINARTLEMEISNLQNESGYPYIINIDTVNKANPINGIISMSNLCSEILQVQKSSVINDDQTYEVLGSDISCNLGSTNITNLMDSKDFGKSVRTMLRALSNVSDGSDIRTVPTVRNGNRLYHSVGLGAMNLHGFLAKNHIQYGSAEALEFTDMYFRLLNFWTLKESNKIAKERNESFHEFELSTYADGSYFDTYVNEDEIVLSETVAKLFENIYIPDGLDWEELKADVMRDGVYNAYRLAVAPTGSISYVNEATASIHPIIKKVEERTEGKRGKSYYPAPYLEEGALPYYISAHDMDQRLIIDTYATAQKHIDQGMSLTIFTRSVFPEGMYEWKTSSLYGNRKTSRDVSMLRNYAWTKGIKSIYYVRTFTDDEEVNSVEACENCSI